MGGIRIIDIHISGGIRMKTVVMLGVGSTHFTKGILERMIQFGGEWDVRMVDIDEKCLDVAMQLGKRMSVLFRLFLTLRKMLKNCVRMHFL